jgi:Porin subfamily.
LSIKNIPTGPGDVINVQAVYTDGATRYNFNSLMGTTYSLYGGSGIAYQSLGIASVADQTYSGTTAATGTGFESVKTWGFRGGYTHNWNANWASAIYGAYAHVGYGGTFKANHCANMVALLALTGTCNPDFNIAAIGFNTVSDPGQGLCLHRRPQRHQSRPEVLWRDYRSGEPPGCQAGSVLRAEGPDCSLHAAPRSAQLVRLV